MKEKIVVTGPKPPRITDTGPQPRRISPAEFAAALGAEPCDVRLEGDAGPITLASVGVELLKRLRSSGGRPGLPDATQRCKVPLSETDVSALADIVGAIERATGARPSLGQIASVILRMHLETLREAAQEKETTRPSKS